MIDPTEPSKPSPEDNHDPDEHHRRMRFQWHDLMEDLIEDGRRRGLFDALPGAGKPLNLDRNIYEGSNTLANQLMKDNDIHPAWLSNRLGVVEKIERFRSEMSRTWERYRSAFDQAQGQSHRQALNVGWDEVCRSWQSRIEEINKEIASYNLKRPREQMELYALRLADELKRIEAPRFLL